MEPRKTGRRRRDQDRRPKRCMWFSQEQRVCCSPYQHLSVDERRRYPQFALAYPGTGQLALNRANYIHWPLQSMIRTAQIRVTRTLLRIRS